MSDPEHDLTAVTVEARDFLSGCRTLVLATVGAHGRPDASYAPFVGDAREGFHIYVSRLARHTGSLLADGRAGVMLIEDEATARQPFARRRLTFVCTVAEIPRADPRAEAMLARFSERFGEVMDLIRPLPDFHLLALSPTSGAYIRGFGRAYAFEGGDLSALSHVDERALRARGAFD